MHLPLIVSLLFTQLPAAPHADLRAADWEGRWEIDTTASDDPMPLVRKLGLSPFKLRRMPKQAQGISVGPEGLQVTSVDAEGEKKQVFPLDGKTSARGELLGVPFEVVSRVEAGVVVSTGSIFIDQARAPFESRRSVEGDVMRVELTVGDVRSRRVFRRAR